VDDAGGTKTGTEPEGCLQRHWIGSLIGGGSTSGEESVNDNLGVPRKNLIRIEGRVGTKISSLLQGRIDSEPQIGCKQSEDERDHHREKLKPRGGDPKERWRACWKGEAQPVLWQGPTRQVIQRPEEAHPAGTRY